MVWAYHGTRVRMTLGTSPLVRGNQSLSPPSGPKETLCCPGTSCWEHENGGSDNWRGHSCQDHPACERRANLRYKYRNTRQNSEVYECRTETEGPGARLFFKLRKNKPQQGERHLSWKQKGGEFGDLTLVPKNIRTPSYCLDIKDPIEEYRWSTRWNPT